MDFEELIGKVGIYTASYVVGFVSGLLPFVNSELYLIAVSPMVSRPALLPIALLSAAGQMTAKTIIFYTGRGVFKINMGKLEKKLATVQEKFREWEEKKRTDMLMLLSATTGYPPFYVLSFVAGAFKLHYLRFFAAGIIGRSVRFVIVIYFPQLVLKYV